MAERRAWSRTRGGRLAFASALSVALSALLVPAPANASASSTIHVASWGADGAAGTDDDPVRTLGHAVWRARSGDEIVLRGGIYRENVQIFGKALSISSAPGERAIFDGATRLTGWQRGDGDGGGGWYVDGWTRQFPQERGDLVHADESEAGYPDQVFFDGRPLRQVLQRSAVGSGTFFHDTDGDRIHIGDDPATARVEASLLPWALYLNEADGSTLTNVTIRRFATPSADLAALRVHSDDVVVTGVTSELNAAAGLSAIGTNIVIRDSWFRDNGHLGVHVHDGRTILVEDSTVVGNNKARFDAKHSAGGIKVTASTGVTVRNNEVSRNGGPGIWTDLSTTLATISYNVVADNGRSGIEVELSQDVSVVSNVVHGNGEAGIWILESQGVHVLHNESYGNTTEIHVLEGPRALIRNVAVSNNLVGNGSTATSLVVVEDWTGERSPAELAVRLGGNRYRGDSSRDARRGWHDIEVVLHVTVPRHDRSAFFPPPSANLTEPAVYGVAVSGWSAEELGVQPGSRLPVGPIEFSPAR